MAGNATPQFTRQANIGSALVNAANTASDGTGNITTPTMYVAFTADATNGSYVESARVMVVASAASTAGAATVIRIYISSVTTGATSSANTWLIYELALPAITADQATTATNFYDIPLGFRIPAGYTILASTHNAANANTDNRVTVFGGDY
jgi:hypothetical protein